MHDCFVPCAMGNVSQANFSEAKLSGNERNNLLEVLDVLVVLDEGEIQMSPKISALARLALDVFTTLTDPYQSLTVGEEMETVALMEKVLKSLAGNLELGTCTARQIESNYIHVCRDTSENIRNRSVYEYKVVNGAGDKDYQTDTSEYFTEMLTFDLQSDVSDISFVVLRTENKKRVEGIKVKQTGNGGASKGTKFKVNSALLAFSVFVEGNKTSVPVNYSLYHHTEAKDVKISIQGAGAITKQPVCAFWHATDLEWSTEGCQLAQEKSTSYSKCICNHSTSFAVILKVN